MATAAPSQPSPMRIKSRGTKGKETASGAANGQQPAIRLRAVVRHLPSLLKESEFRDVMNNYVNDETTDHFTWVQGKIPQDRNKAPTPTRCYIKMKDPMQLTAFSNALRAHGQFTDSKGNATTPQMEFSPFQRAPKKIQRIDSRVGTIESDADFEAFLASFSGSMPATTSTAEGEEEGVAQPLNPNAPAPIPANDPLSVPLPTNEPTEKPKTTPLIEYIRTQKNNASDKSKSKAEGESSRSAKRAERRAREKALKKEKGKEKAEEGKTVEPTALLKRVDSAPARLARQGSSNISSPPTSVPATPKMAEKAPEAAAAKDKESTDKGKGKERERRRGGASGVAAILQRDLGLGGGSRRSRGRGGAAIPSESEPPTPDTPVGGSTAPAVQVATPPTAAQQTSDLASTPVQLSTPRPRERPSRRERRAAKLEREESTASATSTSPSTSAPAQASAPPTPTTPVAVLKRQGSGMNPVQMLKRDLSLVETSSGASRSNVTPTGPAATTDPQRLATPPTTPIGPRGGSGRGGRGRSRGGPLMHAPSQPPAPPTAPTQPSNATANPTPPTGPAADMAGRGGRGRGRAGGYRGGRGRGGGPRGGGPVNNTHPANAGAGAGAGAS